MFLLYYSLFFSTLILLLNEVDANEPPPKTNVTNANFVFTCDVNCKRHGLDALPSCCTALATSNSTYHFIEEVLPLRTGSMKFMRTINDINYDQWMGFMKDDNKVKEITNSIAKFKIDAIVFDNMYLESDEPPHADINNEIIIFHKKIKEKAPHVLFGLRLPKGHIDKAYDLNLIKNDVNFFVVNSFNYRACTKYPWDSRVNFVENLEDTVKELGKSGYPLDKVLLLIDTVAYTKRSSHRTRMTYTEVCSDKKSMGRKFCMDTLDDFYRKAHLVFKYKMMGLYVRWADYDDWSGSCNCEDENKAKTFPILKILEKGRLGLPKQGPLFKCEIKRKD